MELEKNTVARYRPLDVDTAAPSASAETTTTSRHHKLLAPELYSYGSYKNWVHKIRDEWPSST